MEEGQTIDAVPNVSRSVPLEQDSAVDFTPKAILEKEIIGLVPVSIPLIAERRLNRDYIKKLGFYGAASSKSSVIEDGLYLFNDGSAGWASAGLDLAEPMDLSKSSLDFFIKGASGSESLELILRDAEYKSYIPQARNAVFNKNMAREWQFVSIPFNNFNGAYNPKNINHIGFEFGTQTTSNALGVSIYIKNMKIVNNATASFDEVGEE
jgi:hypothetical protein